MREVEEVIKHAVMANHDNEITSIVILMVAQSDPEVHMAVSSDDVFTMNAATDMLKLEMIKLLNVRAEVKRSRE